MVAMQRVRRLVSCSLVLGLAVALILPSPSFAALPFTYGMVLHQTGYGFDAPQMSGRYIVAMREHATTHERDVVVWDRRTAAVARTYIAGDGVDQDYCDVSGDRVVWISHAEADGEVWYDDFDDGIASQRVTNDSFNDVGAAIDGNWIAWVNGIGIGRKIRYYNMETATLSTVEESVLPQKLSVDRGRVAWWDGAISTGKDGVYVYDLETGAMRTVVERDQAVTRIDQNSVDIFGDFVTWSQYDLATPDDRNVWVANIRSGAMGQVTNDPHTQRAPSVFGDLLAWQDDRTGNQNILAWWTPETPGYQTVAVSADQEAAPEVYGHSVAYLVNPGYDAGIGLAVAPLRATRIGGDDRYETSALISRHRFAASSMAVIATGGGFADALSASSLAGALRCPLLLTMRNSLPTTVRTELVRLGVHGAFVIGGEDVVGDGVTDALDGLGITWTRVAGDDRYATARQVANRLIDVMSAENRRWRGEAFFCRGDDFADALAVAPATYALGVPVLLVKPGSVPSATRSAITGLGITRGYVIGGTAAISDPTKAALERLCGHALPRWWGANRFETSTVCARNAVQRGWLDYDALGVATGRNFPDALSGGAASGYYGSPIVLVERDRVPAAVRTFLNDRRFEFGGMDVYGDAGVVSAPTFTALEGYLD
jgi:putative cell wall-binding protein